MLQHVSVDVLANLVLMLRADVDGAILLSDDEEEARFYERCAHEEARVIPAPQVALELLDRMQRHGVHGVVATFRGTSPPDEAPSSFRPSLGDVASLLLYSSSCDKVIRDICGNGWFKACEKEIGPVRNRVAWIARVLGQLGKMCQQAGVAHPNLDPTEIIDWNSFELAWDRLNPILTGSGLAQVSLERAHAMRPGRDLRSDLLESDGMDVVRLLAAATRLYRPRGILALKEIEPAAFISMLRVAFDLREFEHDDIFWRMRGWERANVRYPLLRQWRTLDPLGVLLDQRYWESDLAIMLKLLKPGELLAVLKMDLDNFKQVNEALGHATGDEAIRLYCHVVKSVLGSAGDAYRRGGDEVLVLAPGVRADYVRKLAERTRAEVERAFQTWAAERGLKPAPTASIGVVVSAAETPPSTVIRLADEAQQAAKRQGKNRVVFSE